jgi:hypothetical protein
VTAEHPFLICERSQFPELRDRADREPWATMAADAADRVEAGIEYEPGPSGVELNRYVGARALLYLLQPERRAAHADRVREAIVEGLAAVEFDPAQDWSGTVPPMGAAFVCILALDVVHDDLTPEEIQACEATVERQIGRIDREGSWPAARYGTHGTWAIYTGERTDPDDAFYENYVTQMTDDGVTTVSPGYAFARLGSGDGRPQKTGYADVLQFTGIDERYYDHRRLARFYRWLYSASVNPAKEYHLFGDVAPNWEPPNATLLWRVGRFDRQAARYAAWFLEDEEPPGHLLSYVLMDEPLPEPEVPGSQLFEDGEAVFREPADDPRGLGSALYDITENAEWHTHEEVNAVACSAYGNRLLVNGGWLGDETRPPWKNNTLAIDGRRHEQKTGAGLTEGLLADGFDYACGDSGAALGDEAFRRSLVQVHGDGERGGYFAVFDEVDAAAGATIHSYLQLATESEPEERAAGEYRAAVDHHAEVDGVELAVLYATEPRSVDADLVPSGTLERNPDAGRHYRLETRYDAGDAGQRRIATVLFPSDEAAPGAVLKRIRGDGYTGGTVDFEDATDVVFESDGDERVEAHGVAARARAVVCRQHGDGGFYFARRGTELTRRDRGFESTAPVSIFVGGRDGAVTSPDGAEVTLRHPGATGVRVDGRAVEQTAGSDRIRFDLPPGRHDLAIEAETPRE